MPDSTTVTGLPVRDGLVLMPQPRYFRSTGCVWHRARGNVKRGKPGTGMCGGTVASVAVVQDERPAVGMCRRAGCQMERDGMRRAAGERKEGEANVPVRMR